MAQFVFFDEFGYELGRGTHLLHSHTFKAVLTNTQPSAADNKLLADIAQIANGNGYTTGGIALTSVVWDETGAGVGIWRFKAANFTWTASGGSIGPFRYVVIYNDTAANDPLVGFADRGSSLTLANGEAVELQINATNGIFKLQEAA